MIELAMDQPAPRSTRPKHPLVEPGEARSASDVDERRYLASVLSSGGQALDGFPLDLDACIGSDPIRALLRACEALRRDGKQTGQEHVERWVRENVEDPTRTAALIVAQEPLQFADDLDPVVLTLRQRGAMRRMRREALAILDAAQSGRYGVALAATERLREIAGDAAPEDVRATLSESMRMALQPKVQPGQPLEALSPVIHFEEQFANKVRLRRGEALALGLATNVGKSTILEHWSREGAKNGHRSLIVSVEDSVELFGRKQLSALASLSRDALSDNTLDDEERTRAEREISRIAEAEREGALSIDTVRIRNRSIVGVCQWIRRAGAEGRSLVFVDYLQAIKPDRFFRQRKDAVDYCLNEILAAGATANVALVLASQFARREKTPADMKRKPVLADLKESGDIENSVTYVVLGWRSKDDATSPIFARIAKNKSGGFLGDAGGWQRDRLGVLRTWERPRFDDEEEF